MIFYCFEFALFIFFVFVCDSSGGFGYDGIGGCGYDCVGGNGCDSVGGCVLFSFISYVFKSSVSFKQCYKNVNRRKITTKIN